MKLLNKRNGGFTLVELLIVLAIITWLAVKVLPKYIGVQSSATALEKYTLAVDGTSAASGLFQLLGSGGVTPNNPMVLANNSLEDVLFTGTGVAAAYQTAYDNLNITPMRNMVQVTTEPVAGTSVGVYQDGASVITIGNPANNREMHWVYTPATSEEVAYLVEKYDQSSAYAANTPDTTGTIRYTADGGTGLHTLTIVVAK